MFEKYTVGIYTVVRTKEGVPGQGRVEDSAQIPYSIHRLKLGM